MASLPGGIDHRALTDVGIKRSHNQDAYGVALANSDEAWAAKGHLFLVADGMGAHAVGELASKMAVDTIRLAYGKGKEETADDALRAAITEANRAIHERGQQNRDFQGMGTTATALVLRPDGARVGHVGDSRCYRVRGDVIEQLSFDHSLQWELARKQKVSPEQMSNVPANIIVRSLGPEAKVKVDVTGPYDTRAGDCFVLCSDGLSGPVEDEEIGAIVSHLPPDDAVRLLVDLSNLRGGIDNVTVMLVRVGHCDDKNSRRKPPSPFSWKWIKEGIVRTPWSLRMLAASIVIAAIWLELWAHGLRTRTLAALGVASAGMLFGSLMGLIKHRQHCEKRAKDQPAGPPSPVRRTNCAVNDCLVDRFLATAQSLRELAVEEGWKVDSQELGRQIADAAAAVKAHRVEEAFAGVCRSIGVLATGMRAARDKQEVFRPQWERKSRGPAAADSPKP